MQEWIATQTIVLSIILGSFGILLSDKLKIPGIVIYFAMGIIFGQNLLGVIRPDMLENGLTIIITVFVSIILFEGGASLDIKHISSLRYVLVKQIIISIIIIMAAGYFSARYLAGLSWELSLIFSSIIVVTGPTVIKPIIRQLPLENKVKMFLNGESVLIDAVGAILTVAILEFTLSTQIIGITLKNFLLSLISGLISGVAAGFSAKYILCKTKLFEPASHSYFVLAFVFLSYFVSELIISESGLMAVVITGIILGAIDYKIKEKILNFKDQLSRIIISVLFILLSAGFNLNYLAGFFTKGLIIIFLLIIIRFIIIFLSTYGESFSFNEKIFISWMGPRGIIALSLASIAAIKLRDKGIEQAYTVEILVFMVISVTVVLQGLSAKWIARKLNILVKGDKNIIILGINDITLFIAEEWKKRGNNALLIDTNKKKCSLAEEKGLSFREGNAIDKFTYWGIEVDEYNTALSATDNNEINIIFCRFMKENFGFDNIYAVLNEKATNELSEIIKNDNIKPAFDSLRYSNTNNSRFGFLSKLVGYFTGSDHNISKLTITNPEFLRHNPGAYPFLEGFSFLFVVRNITELYLYHDAFKFELNDEIHVISKFEDMSSLQSLLSA